jgi:hypothetical protein
MIDSLPRRFRSVSKLAEASVAINTRAWRGHQAGSGPAIPLGEPEPLRRGLVERGRDSALMRRPAHCCSGLSSFFRVRGNLGARHGLMARRDTGMPGRGGCLGASLLGAFLSLQFWPSAD